MQASCRHCCMLQPSIPTPCSCLPVLAALVADCKKCCIVDERAMRYTSAKLEVCPFRLRWGAQGGSGRGLLTADALAMSLF